MSYDLYLTPAEATSVQTLCQYFEGRPWYTLNPGDDGSAQVWYENSDTGTYFSFDISDAASVAQEVSEDDAYDAPVAFNMNYFRPHVFGLEAVGEVEAFIQQFQCSIFDPQRDGMGSNFTKDGFLRGWNWGNLFGYRSLLSATQDKDANESNAADLKQRLEEVLRENGCIVAPGEDIEGVWNWNFSRNEIQDEVHDSFFVPMIMWLQDKQTGVVSRCVAWGAGVPIVIPALATHVILDVPEVGTAGLLARAKKWMGGAKPETTVSLLTEFNRIPLSEASPPWHWKTFQGTVFGHGPEDLQQDVLNTLFEEHGVSDLKERVALYPGGSLRNAELIKETLDAA